MKVLDKLRIELNTIYLCYKDPRVPWHAKAVMALVIGYAFSPIDLIPDFIPVIGLLDDAVILPFGIWLSLKLIPEEVYKENREKASLMTEKPVKTWFAVLVISIYAFLAAAAVVLIYRYLKR